MTPAQCRISHRPELGEYGDCLRACVASILDMSNPEQVPHFADGGVNGTEMIARLETYLNSLDMTAIIIPGDPTHSYKDLLEFTKWNSKAYFLLFGATETGQHVVVVKDGEKVHDPAWYPRPIIGAGDNPLWLLITFGMLIQ